jgi:hypothetical protein
MNIIEQLEANDRKREQAPLEGKAFEQGNWVPACGGTEKPFMTRSGVRLLYCWQQSTGRHAYLNCETDLIISDEEARMVLGTF